MAETTWYVLDELDEFIYFLKSEMPQTLLIHMLTTYKKGQQSYGAEKFTTLEEIKDYFKMNYYEWGENSNPYRNGGKRTYFAGSYDIIENYI